MRLKWTKEREREREREREGEDVWTRGRSGASELSPVERQTCV